MGFKPAKPLQIHQPALEDNMKKIAIIMGSDSDFQVAKKAADMCEEFGVPYEVHVYSAHRTPEETGDFTVNAEANGFGVIIALAGMAAHLAGAIAANTTLPVIGVPTASGSLNGLDALLSTVMMPTGIPVATVAINGAGNAALLAIEILALSDPELKTKLQARRSSDHDKVLEKNARIEAEFNR